MTIPVEHKPPKVRVGYLGIEPTKPPTWHSLVTLDLLLNNLTTGLFLTTAACELARPELLGPAARLAYPIALILLLADLTCLVFDLGSPTRFHHMLRVFKPSSPMSLGTWALTTYSLPLTLIVAIDGLSWLGWLSSTSGVETFRTMLLVLGLIPAFASGIYKGVLFSTSSQPGWKDARWFGAYLLSSALTFGAAALHALALATGRDSGGATRWAEITLIVLNLVPLGLLGGELAPTLARVHGRGWWIGTTALVAGVGSLVPLGLLLISAGPVAAWGSLACLVGAGLVWRHAIVMLPHEVQQVPPTSPA